MQPVSFRAEEGLLQELLGVHVGLYHGVSHKAGLVLSTLLKNLTGSVIKDPKPPETQFIEEKVCYSQLLPAVQESALGRVQHRDKLGLIEA